MLRKLMLKKKDIYIQYIFFFNYIFKLHIYTVYIYREREGERAKYETKMLHMTTNYVTFCSLFIFETLGKFGKLGKEKTKCCIHKINKCFRQIEKLLVIRALKTRLEETVF